MNQSHLANESELEEDTVTAGNTSNASRSINKIWSTTQDPWSSGSINPFTGDFSELMAQESLHVNKDSMPIAVYVLFKEIIHLLMANK
jgi:hypothetical protein